MRKFAILFAAATAIGFATAPASAAPASTTSAQSGLSAVGSTEFSAQYRRNWRGHRGWHGHRGGYRSYGYRPSRVCTTRWNYGRRVTVCR